MGVTTTLVVSFGGDAQTQLLQAELDQRTPLEGGLNHSTSFMAGDPAHYLLYRYGITEVTHRCSAGSLVKVGNGSRQVTEVVSFQNSAESALQYPAASLDNVVWLGTDLGALLTLGGNRIRAAGAGVAMAEVTYTTSFEVWRLNSPAQVAGRDTFDILIHIEGQ